MKDLPMSEEQRNADQALQIRADQVRQLHENAPLGMIATVVNAAALAYILRDVVSPQPLALWLAGLLLVTVLRCFLVYRFRRRPLSSSETVRWSPSFIAGMALSGLAWGAAGVFLLPAGSLTHQVFIAFALGGMVAGAAGTFSAIRSAYLAYSIPTLAPLIIRFFAFGDEIHVTMGGMTLLFALLIHIMALRVHNMSVLSLKLRYENSSLVSYLACAKERAEQLNENLRAEIAERTKAEESLQKHQDHLEEVVKERTAEWAQANIRLQEEMAARNVEEALRRSSEIYFRSLIENVSDLITVLDSGANILFESPSIERLLGYRQDELVGTNVFSFLHPDDQSSAREAFARIVATPGSSETIEIRVRHQSSAWRIFESIGKSIVDEAGAVRIVINSRDITDRKRMEEDLLKIQKLESLGTLAGGIAHDFNNIISGITANIELARMHVNRDDLLATILEKAEQASVQAHGLTQQLLTFARGGGPVKKTIKISDLIREAATFALRGAPSTATFSLSDDMRSVEADAGQLRQVIHNIVSNADQAMPRGGQILICGRNVTIGEGASTTLEHGDYVEVTISDQGIGIPPEHVTKIFDPYFTTKQRGSGLGLATAYSIVKKHSGSITVSSELGRGTTISFYLPASAQAAAASAPPGSPLVQGKGRILIMDDEAVVRDAAGRTLESAGYEVESAQEGTEAIALYCRARESGRPFDVVIMDLTVPGGVGGKDAVKKLLEIDPAAKAIVSSGYSQDPVMANYRDYGFLAVISKPFFVREMTEIVAKVVAMKA